MTLQQLKYIVAISKHKSLSKAATTLYLTQPSLSKAVQELENSLNITILDRNNKGVIFTKEGSELLSYAKMLLEQAESITYHFNKQKNDHLIEFSISSQHYGFAVKAFSNLINYYSEQKYEFTLREGKASDVISDVYTSKSIIGVLSLSNLNKSFFKRYFTSNCLEFTVLASLKQHVFLRKEHPLANLKSINFEDLKDYPYLTYQKDDMFLRLAEEDINIDEISKIVYVNDRGTMNNLLSNTNGYNLGTGCIVPKYMNPNIISIPFADTNTIDIGFIKSKNIFLSNEILMYIDFLKKALMKSLP